MCRADYDGVASLPNDMGDVSTYPILIEELLRRGYSEDDVALVRRSPLFHRFLVLTFQR